MNTETNPNDANAETGNEKPKPAGYCRICGKPLAQEEIRNIAGVVYCPDHEPVAPPPPPDSPWATGVPPATDGASPGLAFILGLIPGVGAIYNAQYAKGLVHVVIFGLLISIISSGAANGLEPLFGMLLSCWVFYMAFEAYHTAKKRQRGEVVDEFSSIAPIKTDSNSKLAPILLIAGGVFFLLLTLDLIELYQVVRFWPLLLIGLGAYMLYSRMTGGTSSGTSPDNVADSEVGNERN